MNNVLLVTDAGIAALINAERNGTLPVTISHVAYGTGKYKPALDQTALKEPFKPITAVAGGAVGEHTLHVTAEDASDDTYSVYEIGVFLTDGTLFAVAAQTESFLTKAPASIALLSVDITLADFSAASVTVGDTNFFNPPATTELMGVVELATKDETIEGTDAVRAVTPAALHAKTATDKRIGLIRIATDAEAAAGKSNAVALTPKHLGTSAKRHNVTGFVRMPSGTMLQWGRAHVAAGEGGTTVVFPTAFPIACCGVYLSSAGRVNVGSENAWALPLSYSFAFPTRGNVTLRHDGNGGAIVQWLAVGY